jgi:hypothetical protein
MAEHHDDHENGDETRYERLEHGTLRIDVPLFGRVVRSLGSSLLKYSWAAPSQADKSLIFL